MYYNVSLLSLSFSLAVASLLLLLDLLSGLLSIKLLAALEDHLESLFKLVNVIVNQVLLVDFTLVDQADECETGVNLTQVQHNVLFAV